MSAAPDVVTNVGLCHRVAFTVADLAEAITWFREFCGAQVLARYDDDREDDQDGSRLALIWLGGVPLLPLQPAVEGRTVARHFARYGPSVHSLAWEIDDLWTTEHLLRERGLEITGTHIPGRHFFIHPRQTHGLMLEVTDVTVPNDPRRGGVSGTRSGILGVDGVAWITAAVHQVAPCAELLQALFGATDVPSWPATDHDRMVRIGDVNLRLRSPSGPREELAYFLETVGERFYSITLAVNGPGDVEERLRGAGIGVLRRDDTSVVADPHHTLGVPLEFVRKTTSARLEESSARDAASLTPTDTRRIRRGAVGA